MSLMKGKKGLIMGVANERSIAWGISQKLAEAGAELAFTYLGDALKKRVVPLAEKLNSKVTFSCDVEKKEDVIKLFEDVKSSWGEIDFVVHAIAFSDKSELSGEYLNFVKKISNNRQVNMGDKLSVCIKTDEQSMPDYLKSQENLPIISGVNFANLSSTRIVLAFVDAK